MNVAPRSGGPSLVFLVSVIACGPMGGGGGAGSAAGPVKGDDHPLDGVQAPDFALEAQYGGDSVALADAKGKVAIVDFWATWCEPCKKSFPFYQALLDRHGGELVVLGVSEDESPDGIAAFGQETGVKFPLGWDSDKSVARNYQPDAMPTSFVVDRSGIVRFVHGGFRDGDEGALENAVKNVLGQ